MPRSMPAATPPASKASRAASVVPPFEVTRSRRVASDSLLWTASCAAPEKGFDAHPACRVGIEAEIHGRLFHGFEKIEDISRAAAGNRGDGVHLRLVMHPEGVADGTHQVFGIVAAVLVDAGIGAQAGDAGADQCRRVGHGAHHWWWSPSQREMSARRRPAAMLTTSCAESLPIRGATASFICCGFTASTRICESSAAASMAAVQLTPKRSVRVSRTSADRLDDVYCRCRQALPVQAADEGDRHVAATDEGYFHVWLRSPKIAVPMRTMVAPSIIAASRSSLMPIDKVSSVKPGSSLIAFQCPAQQGELLPLARDVCCRLGDRHQSAQAQPR